jgi:hypothetical protein
VALSDYATKGDKKFADLPQAKNDPKAIKDFLLQSYIEFKKENIIYLVNPTIETIKEKMAEFKKIAEQAG